jgi:hypothetical protein
MLFYGPLWGFVARSSNGLQTHPSIVAVCRLSRCSLLLLLLLRLRLR